MKTRRALIRGLSWLFMVLLAAPPSLVAQQSGQAPVFKQEELDQIVAPIALYPDSLVAQILMASTYPLEVVQADRFAKQNASLKGEALTKALEAQSWDPSVKSLVNFPQVLTMMSEKLEWTQKLGDAFLEQQKPVMDTIQSLRAKAQAAGNLQTTKEQTVIVEEKIIKIEPASPQVVYVPSYNPTVVYGAWPYPTYPPYSYYPPGYVATSMFAFGAGVAMGAAWGYAWGNSNWRGGNVDIDVNRNTNINSNINRSNYSQNVAANGQRQLGSTTLSTGKASRTGIKEPRKNSTAQAHRKRLSHGRIFAAAPTPAGRISRAAARAIAQEQVIAAARLIAQEQVIAATPANSAVATDRQQRIVVEQASLVAERIAAELEVAAAQANSAVVEQIEAALEAAAVPFKASIAAEARQGARVSAVARAVVAAEAAVEDLGVVAGDDLAVAVAVAAGKKSVE